MAFPKVMFAEPETASLQEGWAGLK